ncbi:DUF6207 family protein [Streptomyces sp. NPDC059991]|uniref:DUF6207 family protein n=1 Tax=Streptomyces sp. NPDC059991 TaxID=3347028 RepID=UPI0036826FB2
MRATSDRTTRDPGQPGVRLRCLGSERHGHAPWLWRPEPPGHLEYVLPALISMCPGDRAARAGQDGGHDRTRPAFHRRPLSGGG